MEKIQLGHSEVHISPIVFGAWAIGGWMWGGTDDEKALEALRSSFEGGVTTIDTAPIYGLGHSEKVVGKFVKEVGREKVEILTKFGWNWEMKRGEPLMKSAVPGQELRDVYSNASREGILKEVDDSLQRLGTDYIDLYQMHRPDPNTPMQETVETCQELQKLGKIRAFGVSNTSTDLMSEGEQVMDITASQSPFSMVYQKIKNDILPYCIARKIGVLAYSPLQRGLLTGKIDSDYVFAADDHRSRNKFFKEPNRSRTNAFLDRIRPIAQGHGVHLSQLVINWTVQQKGISGVLVGARDAMQAKENARSLDFSLSDSEMQEIDQELKKVIIDHNV